MEQSTRKVNTNSEVKELARNNDIVMITGELINDSGGMFFADGIKVNDVDHNYYFATRTKRAKLNPNYDEFEVLIVNL
jgi:hypothetical protein